MAIKQVKAASILDIMDGAKKDKAPMITAKELLAVLSKPANKKVHKEVFSRGTPFTLKDCEDFLAGKPGRADPNSCTRSVQLKYVLKAIGLALEHSGGEDETRRVYLGVYDLIK